MIFLINQNKEISTFGALLIVIATIALLVAFGFATKVLVDQVKNTLYRDSHGGYPNKMEYYKCQDAMGDMTTMSSPDEPKYRREAYAFASDYYNRFCR